jgi:hypothetical protein
MSFDLSITEQSDLFVYALRYAMGRRTAAPTGVSQAILNHWPQLDDRVKNIILRDLSAELVRDAEARVRGLGGTLGDNCDRDTWANLHAKLCQDRSL